MQKANAHNLYSSIASPKPGNTHKQPCRKKTVNKNSMTQQRTKASWGFKCRGLILEKTTAGENKEQVKHMNDNSTGDIKLNTKYRRELTSKVKQDTSDKRGTETKTQGKLKARNNMNNQ